MCLFVVGRIWLWVPKLMKMLAPFTTVKIKITRYLLSSVLVFVQYQ